MPCNCLSGRNVRRGRVPVRRHVLPRQVEGVFGGPPSAEAGRRFHFQRVGSDRGKRIRGHRDDGARIPVSRGSAALPGPHAPRLSRPCDHRAGPRKGGFTARPKSPRLRRAAGQNLPAVPAIAYCQGTPLRNEIEARDASRLGEATDIAAEAIAQRFGRGPVDGKIQAHIVTIER